MSNERQTETADRLMPMIYSARDQIAMNRRCERQEECDTRGSLYRVGNCDCLRDAFNSVTRDEASNNAD